VTRSCHGDHTYDLLELLHTGSHEAPLLRSTFAQLSFTSIDADAIGLEAGAIERFLHDRVGDLASPEDFAKLYHADGGVDSWCPVRLFVMLTLQFRYGESDREVVRRASRDLGWKYAMRLGPGEKAPSRTAFQRFRKQVREKLGEDFVHERVLRLARGADLLGDTELQAGDSTNTDCRGARLDTFNLIARGIANVLRKVSDWTGEPLAALAERLWLEDYLARSMKGTVDIDWTSRSERDGFVSRLVRDADRLVAIMRCEEVTALEPPPGVCAATDLLWVVAHQDVEQLVDGSHRIRKGTARGRTISITDPEARHGRKSSSKVIHGHKTHVLTTLDSALVTAILITDAGKHDAIPCADLLRQAAALGLMPLHLLGDLAYGTGRNRRDCAELGVTVLTKPAAAGGRGISKSEFDIDQAAMSVTCPGGQRTERYTMVKAEAGSDERVAKFVFLKATCAVCPLAEQCCKATREGTRGRSVKLSIYEAEFQQAKAFSQTPDAKPLMRKRCGVERVLSHLMRYGLRRARYFSQSMTQFQAFMTAAAYNLQRVATLLAARVNTA
jgi:IS5 family transposase